jgi:hypothetical protein
VSNLERLRQKALAHAAAATVRYPVCLNPDRRHELQQLANAIQNVANTAAAQAVAVAETVEAPKRRTIGTPAPVPLEVRQQAAEQAVQPLRDRAAILMAQAAEEDDLVVVVFGVPADKAGDPAAFYAEVTAKYPTPSLAEREIRRDLVVASYLRTEAPNGDDLGFDWDTARTHLLNHADLESLDEAVLSIYREPSAVPFDPATFGVALKS